MAVTGGAGEALTPEHPEKAEFSGGRQTRTDCSRLLCASLVILGQGGSDLVQMHVPHSQTLGSFVFN